MKKSASWPHVATECATTGNIMKEKKEKHENDTTEKSWTKKCPKCGGEQSYSCKTGLSLAIRENTKCRSCSKSGKNHPFYGKKRPEYRKKMSGRKRPEHSKRMSGKNHVMYGKTYEEVYGKEKAKEIKNSLRGKRPSMQGKNNPMYGRSNHDIWVEKYGIEEANRRHC